MRVDAPAQFRDAIGGVIAGQQEADAFLLGLNRRYSHPDELAARITALREPAKLRGFCRRVQKFLERAAL